jgi:hypothetical protein
MWNILDRKFEILILLDIIVFKGVVISSVIMATTFRNNNILTVYRVR